MKKKRFLILRAFIKKEIVQVLRDPRMRFVLFLAPIVQLIVFGLALSSETRNIRLALWAKPNHLAMHDFYNRALGTQWFIPAKTSGSNPFDWVRSSEADAVLVASSQRLERDVTQGYGEIQVLINAQNNSRAQAIELYLKTIATDVFKHPNLQKGSELRFEIRALYNPTFKTSLFMVPGVLSMLVCLITILLTSMAIAREKETGTFETLTSAPLDAWDLMLGKTVPFILIGSVQMPLVLAFAVFAFDLPIRGPISMLVVASLLMLIATVAIGLLISTIAQNQQQAMLGGFIYLFPSYLLSGLMFPIENMPIYFQPFAYLNPLSQYMGLLRNILIIGGEPTYFMTHASLLCGIAMVIAAIAFRRFKRMIL